MAKLTDDQIVEAFQPHLQQGETVSRWAYGIKQPSMAITVPLIALGVLPGVIAMTMLTKHFLVGLTEKRLIALQIKGFSNAEVKEVIEYNRAGFAANPANVKDGKIFTSINIKDESKPFRVKFHRAFSKNNRPHAQAIIAAIGPQGA